MQDGDAPVSDEDEKNNQDIINSFVFEGDDCEGLDAADDGIIYDPDDCTKVNPGDHLLEQMRLEVVKALKDINNASCYDDGNFQCRLCSFRCFHRRDRLKTHINKIYCRRALHAPCIARVPAAQAASQTIGIAMQANAY